MQHQELLVRRLDPTKSQLTIDVRVTREFRFRIWLGVRLIRLAAWIIGFGVVVTHTEDQ